MRAFTASASALLPHCTWWLRDEAVWLDDSNRRIDLGVERHAVAQAMVEGGDGVATEQTIDTAEAMAPLIEEAMALGDSYAEISFACAPDFSSVRVLGVGEGRSAYARALPGEHLGTADLVVVTPDAVIVIDAKSHATGVDVDAREQLRTLAFFAARHFMRDRAEIRTLLLGHRYARWHDEEELDADDLDRVVEERAERLAAPDETPTPGDWCSKRYCPCRTTCDAAIQAVESVELGTVPGLVQQHRLSLTIASDDHLEWSLAMVKLARGRLDEIEHRVHAYADARETAGEPATFADGRVYRNEPKPVTTPRLDVEGALAVLEDAGALGAVRQVATWDAIETEIGAKAARGVRETLFAIGAVSQRTQDSYLPRPTEDMKAAKKSRKRRTP